MKKKLMFIILFMLGLVVISAENVFAAGVTSYVSCGSTALPSEIAGIIRAVFLILQICVPVGIIVMGSLDFAKAVIASDADKIKKNQKKFITRLITGALVFFVFAVVKFIIKITDTTTGGYANCLNCLINSNEGCHTETESPFNPDASADDDDDEGGSGGGGR
ncbi:MAG: hypothetical protein IJ509_02315 [Bacilli bacterium]|nr:hypothetical protein [Bacilli bacterium]MBQ8681725.1 hypothetical protein [Bacilli bacterium]